jgi:hypothetical protein
MTNSQEIVVIVVALVMGWFAFGILYNLRRGNALLRWIQVGLPRIGERTTFRWLGTSAVEMVIQKARPPFRRQEIVIVLTPRDVPWLWLIAMLRGRRDTLILRAHLVSSPRSDLELADPKTWTGRMALEEASERGWESKNLDQGPFQGMRLMAPKGLLHLAEQSLAHIGAQAISLSPRYSRISLHRSTPNLELHIPFPDRNRPDAARFFEDYQQFARRISENIAND